jgi:hypothetical protein
VRLNRPIDAVEGARLALPAGVVSEPVKGSSPARRMTVRSVDLAVTALGLLDETMDGGLIEHLAALKDTDVLPQEPMDRR